MGGYTPKWFVPASATPFSGGPAPRNAPRHLPWRPLGTPWGERPSAPLRGQHERTPSSLRPSPTRHCERSAAIQGERPSSGLLRRRHWLPKVARRLLAMTMPPAIAAHPPSLRPSPTRHCERSAAIQGERPSSGLLRRRHWLPKVARRLLAMTMPATPPGPVSRRDHLLVTVIFALIMSSAFYYERACSKTACVSAPSMSFGTGSL
jgi:hypothetical protein